MIGYLLTIPMLIGVVVWAWICYRFADYGGLGK